jgi:hypothetical protein
MFGSLIPTAEIMDVVDASLHTLYCHCVSGDLTVLPLDLTLDKREVANNHRFEQRFADDAIGFL